MERRLLKDFQIGLVEGLIQDAMTSSDKGPKDVFSKIAKAIGRRTSQGGSKKKDWNAMVRQKSVARDPIGSTAEGTERRHRQSVRRYILDHQKDSLMSMDANKLVEYNPLLAEIAPAARVAYAKFKIPKIKQEYEENTMGADEVFDNAPSVDVVDETKKKGSIARPRPKSTRNAPVAGALPYPSVTGPDKGGDANKPASTTPIPPTKKLQKTKTVEILDVVKPAAKELEQTKPIETPEDVDGPRPSAIGYKAGGSGVSEGSAKRPEKVDKEKDGGGGVKDMDKEKNAGGGVKDADKEKDGSGGAKDADKEKDASGGAKDADKEKDTGGSKDTDKAKDVEKSKEADTAKVPGKDKDDKHLKPESPKRSASPKKPGGKSKVTGEILTGWL